MCFTFVFLLSWADLLVLAAATAVEGLHSPPNNEHFLNKM